MCQSSICVEDTGSNGSKFYKTAGAPFLTVDAMLGGMLGIAAGYLAM